MVGIRWERVYPILFDGKHFVRSKIKKAEMKSTFRKVHSPDNLSEEERRNKEETREKYGLFIQTKGKVEDKYNVPFTLRELKSVRSRCWTSAPGKDEICHMLKL